MVTNPNYRRWRRIFIWSMFMVSFMGLYILFEEKLIHQTEVFKIPFSVQSIEYFNGKDEQ
jgi:hypothetical protein